MKLGIWVKFWENKTKMVLIKQKNTITPHNKWMFLHSILVSKIDELQH